MRIAKVKIDNKNRITIPTCLIKANPEMRGESVFLCTGRVGRYNEVIIQCCGKYEDDEE